MIKNILVICLIMQKMKNIQELVMPAVFIGHGNPMNAIQ